MNPSQKNWSPETKELWEKVETLGKAKNWNGLQIHQAFIHELDKQKIKEEKENRVVRLPVEANEHRAAPNVCLRSALFSVIKPGRRKFLDDAVVASQNGYQVIYSGERLDQSDFDVWLAVKHICLKSPLERKVRFKASEIFSVLKKPDGGANRKWLKRSIARLHKCSAGMKSPNGSQFSGHLIEYWDWDEETYEFVVTLSSALEPLFAKDTYTVLAIEDRQKLHKDLSKWLFSYWSSHNEIYPIKDETLYKLCGSEGSIKHFREHLRRALKELEGIGFLQSGAKVDRKGLVVAKKAKRIRLLKKKITEDIKYTHV